MMVDRFRYAVFLIVLAGLSSAQTLAEAPVPQEHFSTWYGGVGIGSSIPEVDNIEVKDQTDEDLTFTAKVFAGYRFNPNWGVELGYKGYEDIDFDTQRDQVSEYDVELGRKDIYLTSTFEIDPRGFLPIRLGAGFTYSELEFTVDEDPFGLAPSQQAKESDQDFGLYLMAGFKPFNFARVSSLVSVEYIYRNEMFDESSRPLNSSDLSFGFSVMLH